MTDRGQSFASGSSESEVSWPLDFGGVKIDESRAAKAFCDLTSMFYERNFGTTSKAEIELVMFRVFNEAAGARTDFALARQLGVSTQVVGNRRTRLALRSEEDPDWTTALLSALDSNACKIVNPRGERGCEIRIMFDTKINVLAFQNALIRNEFFFDGTFNNLVVTTSLSSVVAVLLREVADETGIDDVSTWSFFKYLKERKNLERLPAGVQDQIAQLTRKQLAGSVGDFVGQAAGCLADSLTDVDMGALGDCLKAAFVGEAPNAKESVKTAGGAIGIFVSFADKLSKLVGQASQREMKER